VTNPAPRRRLDPEARKAQLIGIGLDHIRQHPIDQLALEEVISTAGISNGLLYHYFPTKIDYQVAVVEEAADELLDALRAVTLSRDPSMFLTALDAFVVYVETHREAYVAVTRGAGSDAGLMACVDRAKTAIIDLLQEKLSIPDDPNVVLLLRGWLAFVEEITLQWIKRPTCPRSELVQLLELASEPMLEVADRVALGRAASAATEHG